MLVPVVLAALRSVGDDQGRRVPEAALREQRGHVLVQVRHRQVVLDARVAVEHHRLVVVEQRAALRDDEHLLLARRLDDHLPRVAPLLVVALDRERPDGLHAADVRARVVDRATRRT